MTDHKYTIDQYRDALECLVYMLDGTADGQEWDHYLLLNMDGDGWNEPLSEAPACTCGVKFEAYYWTQEWEGAQIKSRADLAVEWNMHYNGEMML